MLFMSPYCHIHHHPISENSHHIPTPSHQPSLITLCFYFFVYCDEFFRDVAINAETIFVMIFHINTGLTNPQNNQKGHQLHVLNTGYQNGYH